MKKWKYPKYLNILAGTVGQTRAEMISLGQWFSKKAED